MTNPISKAIVKAAVAMGYGKKSDYKGSSVADVLEKFAAIAKDKGGSGGGGGAMYATFTEDNGAWRCDKTYVELKAACDAGSVVLAQYAFGEELKIAIPMVFMENEQTSALVAYNTIQNAQDTSGIHFVTVMFMNSSSGVFGRVTELICKASST